MKATYKLEETDKIAEELLGNLIISNNGATILALNGELGAGKTTLVKSLAKILGIEENVVSPTFVIAKFYETNFTNFKKLVHIDAYRIEDARELDKIGWQNIANDKENLVIIEWPTIVQSYLPKDTNIFAIEHGADMRTIKRI